MSHTMWAIQSKRKNRGRIYVGVIENLCKVEYICKQFNQSVDCLEGTEGTLFHGSAELSDWSVH